MIWSLESSRTRVFLWALGLAGLYAFALALRQSSAFDDAGAALSVGLAVDLTLTASLFTWFMVLRAGHLPRVVLVPVFVLGVAAANVLVPAEHGRVVLALAYAWAAAEGILALVALARVRRIARSFRDQRDLGTATSEAFERALVANLPSKTLAAAAACELAILWYGLAGWWMRSRLSPLADRNLRQWTVLAWMLAFLMTVEAVGAHVLVRSWSETAAWGVTVLHVYSLVWLFGDLHALRSEVTELRDGVLRVRLGLRARADVPLAAIARVETVTAAPDDEKSKDYLRAHVLFSPSAVLHLTEPVEVRLLFGRRRQVSRIGLAIADTAELASLCEPVNSKSEPGAGEQPS